MACLAQDVKLMVFLKKTLEVEIFERIRCTEQVIVCSSKDDKKFMFVVLSDNWIYLTENPPKRVYEAVHIGDIESVHLVNKLTEFLSGAEQKNCQHIVVSYVKLNVDSTATAPEAEIDSKTKLLMDTNSSIVFPYIGTARYIPGSARSKMQSDLEDRSIDDYLKMEEFNETNDLESEKNSKKSKNAKKKIAKTNTKISQPKESTNGNNSLKLDLRELTGSDQLSPRTNGNGTLSTRDLNSTLLSGVEPENGETTIEHLHLYILNGGSPFFALVNAAWNNYNIRGTLEEDVNYCKHTWPVPTKRNISERMEHLYSKLKAEILEPNNTLADMTTLVAELKTGAERNFVIKKFFWKSNDVFNLLMKELVKYAPKWSLEVLQQEDESNQVQKLNELTYCTLLVDVLQVMLRETDVVPTRSKVIVSVGQAAFDAMLRVLFSVPHSILPSRNFPADCTVGQQRQRHLVKPPKNEVELLVEDFEMAARSLLFEVVLLAQQGQLQFGFGGDVTCHVLAEKLDATGQLDEFLHSQLMYDFELLWPLSTNSWSPYEAVNIFKHFFTLNALIDSCASLEIRVRNKYTDEFKYFLKLDLLRTKIPQSFLIKKHILLLLKDVLKNITGYKPKMLQLRK